MASSGYSTSNSEECEVSEGTLDRISQLPGSLIVEILSRMPTMYAVRTCMLSKRWRYLWTFIHSFSFTTDYEFYYWNDDKFVHFVDNVLVHSVSSNINKFKLSSNYLDNFEAVMDRCLSFAVDRKVKDIEFSSDPEHDDNCSLPPQPLSTCSTLKTLVLHHCYFAVDVVIAWKSLMSITLELMELSDGNIVNLLSGCPALETMELKAVHGFSRLDISSFKLKRLTLKDYYWLAEVDSLEIVAPYLQHLKISGDLYNLQCRLVDVSSVVSAELTFNVVDCIKDIQNGVSQDYDDDEESCSDYHKVIRTLVQTNLLKLSCATELTIGTWFTEVLCMLQSEGVEAPELKCKYLILELDIERSNMYGLAGLLQASPLVETLDIDMSHMTDVKTSYDLDSVCLSELGHLAKGESFDLGCWISSFEFPNLKNVKITVSYKLCLKDHLKRNLDKLFEISKILLKNAKVLEKFVIISKRKKKCKSCSKNCGLQYLTQLAEKFVGCPRSSTKSVIMILEA